MTVEAQPTEHYGASECPCCAGSCIPPSGGACQNCEEGECEKQGRGGEHRVEPLWSETDGIVCKECGCTYAIRVGDERKEGGFAMHIDWVCDADEDIKCKCCEKRGVDV